jgi:NAD(P)-dependent dehydrogenase (short-subunit alcohol dehydrogenase family)
VSEAAILVTGASSGIGAACALRLARAGHRVVGVSRSGTVLPGSDNLSARVLDIRDLAAVERTVKEIAGDLGRLDAVINAAGIAVAGPLEDTPLDLIRAQFETTLLGAVYMIRAAAPYLRQFAPSRFIQISSLASHVALPYQSLYCASHSALSGLCESLRYELEPQGVRVIVIEPGSVRTAITKNRRTAIAGDAYRTAAGTALGANDVDEHKGIEAESVARVVEQVLTAQSPPDRRSVGHWQERISLPVRGVLPARWFRRIIAAHYRLGPRP